MRTAEDENRRYFRQAYQTGVHGWDAEPSPYVAEHLGIVGEEVGRGRVLDLGCGEGRHCVVAARMGFRAVGMDYEPLAVKRAVENVRHAGCDASVRFAVGDALALPFRSGSFDVVLDYGCLHHQRKSDWPAYLAGVKAVLVPRGWLVLSVFSTRFAVFGAQKRRWHIAHGAYRRFFTREDIEGLFARDSDFLRLTEEREGPRGFWHALMRQKERG
jgi:SAM-dependent methyltransferase